MSPAETRRALAMTELAERYEREGFVVSRFEPIMSGVADLVARRGSTTVLTEVRVAGAESPKGTALARFAEYAAERHWRFVIAVVDSRGLREIEPWSSEEVLANLAEVERLPAESAARGLLAWSSLEAAARVALARVDAVAAFDNSVGLVQQLASRGLISLEEERDLLTLARARNRAAHGLRSDELADFDLAVQVARKLVASSPDLAA